MAESTSKLRRAPLGMTGLDTAQTKFDKALSDRGFFYEENVKKDKAEARTQAEKISQQQNKEKLRLAEAESEVQKRTQALTRSQGGRSLLIATSAKGIKGNLGGTQ